MRCEELQMLSATATLPPPLLVLVELFLLFACAELSPLHTGSCSSLLTAAHPLYLLYAPLQIFSLYAF